MAHSYRFIFYRWRLTLATLLSLTTASLPCALAQEPASSNVGVPSVDPDYEGDVRGWWSKHPLNPRSDRSLKEIRSPEPEVRLKSGDSIDEAVRKLSETGGTIRLAAGTYGPFAIVGRSHIHLLGPGTGEAIITGHSYLAVDEESMNYPKYDSLVSHVDTYKYKDQAAWKRYQNPPRDFLLRNLVFDGEGKTVVDFPGTGIQGKGGALGLKRVRDVVVENCTFRNYLDTPPKDSLQHCGVAWGHYGLTNIWFRGCKFLGAAKYAVYLDGAHGSGFVDCTIDGNGFSHGGLLFLANHDFTDDLNENGTIDPAEEKCAKFVVIADNTFTSTRGAPIRYTGRDLLVTGNRFEGVMLETVGVYPTGEVAHRTWPAGEIRVRILDNKIGTCARAILNIFELDPPKVELAQKAPLNERYTVEGNTTVKIPKEILYSPLRPK